MNRQALLLILLGVLVLVGGIALYSPRAAVLAAAVVLLLAGVLHLDVPPANKSAKGKPAKKGRS